MTSKEKKKYLQQYGKLDRKINRLLEEQEKWRALATRTSPIYSDMPKASNCKDKIQTAVEKIALLELEIDAEIDRLVDMRYEIKTTINSVENEALREVLLRYVHCLKWEQVAETMRYELRWVYVLHGRALHCLKLVNSQTVL